MSKNKQVNENDRGRMADSNWTSRKRIQTALRLGQPDRVPWFEHSVAPAIRGEIMRCRPEDADLVEFAEMIGLDAVTYMGSQPMLWGNGVLRTRSGWESWVATWPDTRSEAFWVGLDRFIDKVRKTDLAIGYVGGLSCAMVIESWNLEEFCYLMVDDMAFIREMFDRYLEWDMGFYERLLRRDLDFLAPGNDLADSKGPRFSPEFYRQEVFPREKLVTRNINIPWIYHSCGNFLPFVEDVLAHGCNGIEPFQANAVDIVAFKREYGHRVCVKGGVNIDTLVMRTPDDVEAEVRDRITRLAPGGGYIIASSHSIYGDCKPANVVRMAEAIRKHGRYPTPEPVFAFPQEKKKTRSASGELPDGLIYKADQDLAKVKERFAAFWQGEIVDRVCLAVTAPNGANVPVPVAENDEQAHTDPEFLVRRCNAEFSNTWYGGDALPMAWAPGQLLYAAYGGKASFASGTVWVDPTLTDGQQWADYRFDPANPFIEHVVRITRALAEDAPGKYLVASPGIFGPTDAMSMIRGMADFLMEIALPEYEGPLRHAHRECLKGFSHITDAVYRETGGSGGAIGYLSLWAPGPINNWSADWIYNIGPRQFEQWVLPEMRELSRLLEYSLYHLDGFNALVHLPMILDIPELQGIQFERGAGHTLAEALPVFKRIQQGGKVQWIGCAPNEVELVLSELDPRGLFIRTWASDIASAQALLKNAEKWSCRRHRGLT